MAGQDAQPTGAEHADQDVDPFRDDTGAIRPEFLHRVTDSIRHHDSAVLHDLIA